MALDTLDKRIVRCKQEYLHLLEELIVMT